MTTQLESTKFDPKLQEEDLRRMSVIINQLVQYVNKTYSESKVKSISSNYTVDDTFSVGLVSATAARTLTLPDARTVPDRAYTFIKTDSSTAAMKITGFSASQTINGSTATSVTTQFGVRKIATDGIKWYRII